MNDRETAERLLKEQIATAFSKPQPKPFDILVDDKLSLSFRADDGGLGIVVYAVPDEDEVGMNWEDAATLGAWLVNKAAEHGASPRPSATAEDEWSNGEQPDAILSEPERGE